MKFQKSSRKVPKQFQINFRKVSEKFQKSPKKSSRKVQEKFQKSSKKVPEKFQKSSKKIPKKFQKSSKKQFQKVPTKFQKSSQMFQDNIQSCPKKIVRSFLLITLIKCLKGLMSLGLLFICQNQKWLTEWVSESVSELQGHLITYWAVRLSSGQLKIKTVFGQVMSPHHSDQMYQRSQVSRAALCMWKSKSGSVREWVSESVSEWQGHLLSCQNLAWTAKKKYSKLLNY